MVLTLDHIVDLAYDIYAENISTIPSNFSRKDIEISDDLASSAKRYGYDDVLFGAKALTFLFENRVKVIILRNENYAEFSETVLHEMIHVRDILWFKEKYNASPLNRHYLGKAFHLYTEFNAYKYGALGAQTLMSIIYKINYDFISKNDILRDLETQKAQCYTLDGACRILGYASYLDNLTQVTSCSDEVLAALCQNEYLSRLLRQLYELIQQYPPDLEEMDDLLESLD